MILVTCDDKHGALPKIMFEQWLLKIDYYLFSLICLSALVALTAWIRRIHGTDRILAWGWCILMLVLVFGWFVTDLAGKREQQRMRTRIESLAPTYAHELTEMGHQEITLQTSADNQDYLEMIEQQKIWLELNPLIADIYTFRKHSEGNQLIVDSETDYDKNGKFEGDREQRFNDCEASLPAGGWRYTATAALVNVTFISSGSKIGLENW